MKLIRYHLPTIVKHVLAPKNDFGIQKTLGKFTKVLGFEKTPPPPFGKNTQKIPFFLWGVASLIVSHKSFFVLRTSWRDWKLLFLFRRRRRKISRLWLFWWYLQQIFCKNIFAHEVESRFRLLLFHTAAPPSLCWHDNRRLLSKSCIYWSDNSEIKEILADRPVWEQWC